MLKDVDSTATGAEMAKAVGSVQVRYGFVGQSSATPGSQPTTQQGKLAFAEMQRRGEA